MAAVPQLPTNYARRKTPKQAAKRDARDLAEPDSYGAIDPGAEEQSRIKDALAILVNERIRESVMARETSGIEEEWREADDLFNGWDELNAPRGDGMRVRDKNSAPRHNASQGNQSTLVLNITKPKTKVAVARVKEMLVPTSEKPWDIQPTPVPDLDRVMTDPALAGQNVTLGDGTQAPALAVVEIAREKAAEATRGEADWIEDRFVEGAVYAEMRKVIDDAGRLGTGCLKGPFPVCRKNREWSIENGVARLTIDEKREPTSKRIRMEDAYPDPACGDNIHRGNYFNEREFCTERDLQALAEDPSYDQQAIAAAILEGPMAQAMDRATGTKSRKKPGDSARESKMYTLWYSHGNVPADALIAMGVKDVLLGNDDDNATPKAANDEYSEDDEPASDPSADAERAFDPDGPAMKQTPLSDAEKAALARIPSMVTMLNGRPIKAVIQPLDSGEFPYDFFPWEPVDGQPYGRGIPIAMRPAQVIVKSGVRRMLENGGLSAGPQIAISDGLEPMDKRMEIVGRKLWRFTPTDLIKDIRAAMAMFEIPSMQQELLEIINFGLEMADRLTNIPMLLQGDQQAGTSPETLGGMKLLVQNSMAPLRDIAKQYDDYLITPHLGRYHEWFMTHVPDKPKGDADIKALGSTALVQREEGREFLMNLAPVKDDPSWRIDDQKFAKEMARSNGYDISLIQYTDEEWKKAPKNPANAQPQEPYQVQVAKIKAKVDTDKAGAQHLQVSNAEGARQVHEEEDRKLRVEELRLKAQELEYNERIAMLTYGAKTGETIEKIKKDLAIAAQQSVDKNREMALKTDPANVSHTGI